MRAPQFDQQLETALLSADERNRLVRLCTQLTADRIAADDLVQETLFTAWQRRDQVTDLAGLFAWLATIARNHYRHWVRSQRRRQQYVMAADEDALARVAVTDIDLMAELDRAQFVTLLDRAMTHLPAATQTLLVQHYLDEIPQAELAAQMGINSGAVAGRLHRGKALLRRLLVTKFRDDALALGLLPSASVGWLRTRIWCSACGQQKLWGQFVDGGDGQLWLRCDCGANHGISGPADLLADVRGYRPALTRAKQWQHVFLQRGLCHGEVECPHCCRTAHVQLTTATPQLTPDSHAAMAPTLLARCTTCHWQLHMDIAAFAGSFPAHIHFGRQHPRVKTLPIHKIDFHGAPALVVPTQSITSNAQLDLIFHVHTFALLDTIEQ